MEDLLGSEDHTQITVVFFEETNQDSRSLRSETHRSHRFLKPNVGDQFRGALLVCKHEASLPPRRMVKKAAACIHATAAPRRRVWKKIQNEKLVAVDSMKLQRITVFREAYVERQSNGMFGNDTKVKLFALHFFYQRKTPKNK